MRVDNSMPPYVFMAMYLVKYEDIFMFIVISNRYGEGTGVLLAANSGPQQRRMCGTSAPHTVSI
jgi:hypothetical protein